MLTTSTDTSLLQEKDRIYRLFSDTAHSLRCAFFEVDSGNRTSSDVAGADVLQHVLDYTREYLHAEKCALFLDDLPATSLILERVSGEVDFAKLKDIATYDLRQIGPGSGVTPWVYHRKKPFNARTFDELLHNSEGHWKGNWDRPLYGGSENARAKFQCVYMAPLMAGDRAIGVIKYENRTPGARTAFFDEREERLIDMIAALLTNLVVSQRIERNRYDRILPDISTNLVSHFEKPSSFEPLLTTCRDILSADMCSLFLVDSEASLYLECIVGVSSDKKNQLRGFKYENYPTARGLTPWILRKQTPFNVRSYPDLRGRSENQHLGRWDAIVYDGSPENLFKSLYSIPLIIGADPIGVFKVENKNIPPYYFTESDERLFDMIGRLIAVGVRYAKTRENEQYLLQMARSVELGFLAAGISHEFNTSLQSMLGRVRTALDCCADEIVKAELIRIKDHIDEAARMINRFTEIQTTPKDTVRINVDEEVKRILELSRERMNAHRVKITYRNLGVDELNLNLRDVRSIVVNLINNALDAVAEIEGLPRTIDILVRPGQDERFILEVADSGRGISPQTRQLVFAPFFTTKDGRTIENGGGTGIGLYLVQRLANSIGGRVSCESPNDHGGATFCVTLPRTVGLKE
jgi:signal transduction histidine kinase